MNAAVDGLPPGVVRRLLDVVEPAQAIVVGGQAIAVWAERYRPSTPELFDSGSLASKDLDFLRNEPAIARLVRELGATVRRPSMDDHTPNAALVHVDIDGHRVPIDFMNDLKGVDFERMIKRRVRLTRDNIETGKPTNIYVMHPLDCMWSRFGNINLLPRTDPHSLNQGRASLLIFVKFILEEIASKRIQQAQILLMELTWLVKKVHAGRYTHIGKRTRLFPERILAAFADDEAFDERWRELTFKRQISRVKEVLDRHEARAARLANRHN